jgi:hypothetical protein
MGQTTYLSTPLAGHPGQISDTGRNRDVVSFFCTQSGGIKPGRAVVVPAASEFGHSDPPRGIYPAAAAADPDAIVASGVTSTAGTQTIEDEALNGAVGGGVLDVPAPVTFTFGTSTDWDATTGVLTAILPDGTSATEDIAIPNGGNAVVTSTRAYRQFVSFFIPAQTGTGGSLLIGYAQAGAALDARQFLGVAHLDSATEVASDGLPVIAEDRDGAAVREGRVYVETDQAVTARAPVYVRTAGTASLVGVFRADSDSGNAALLPGAMFLRSSASGLAEVQLDGTV